MKQNEKEFLVNEKEANGEARNKAWSDVNDLIKSEKAFKILYKEKEKLLKELEKANQLIKEQKQTIFNLKFKLDKTDKEDKPKKESTKKSTGNLIYYNRILNFMQVGVPYTKTDLIRNLLIPQKEVEDWLKFIMEHKLLPIQFDGVHYTRKICN